MVRTVTPPTAAAERPVTQRRQLLAVGLLIAAFLVFFPTKQLVAQKVRMNQLETRLAELEATNSGLEAEARRLSDPEEVELLARERLGLVRPGEESYLFVPPASPEPAPGLTVAERGGWLSRTWEAVIRFIRGRPSGPDAG